MRRAEGSYIGRREVKEVSLKDDVRLGCVWMDYHSVPQKKKTVQEFYDAISSIPYYVERCDYFWICAPPALHHDLNESRDISSWRGRGWCRLEEVINFLSRTLKMPLVVTNVHRISTFGFLDACVARFGRPDRSVLNGQFTCCHRDHKMCDENGTELAIPCDKGPIVQVLAHIFDLFFEHSRVISAAAGATKRRQLRTVAPALLAGCEELLPAVAHKWGISAEDGLEEIVALRPEMLYSKGTINLSQLTLAVHRPSHEFREIIACLSADRLQTELDYLSNMGRGVVDRAAKLGFHENLEYLLKLRASTDPVRKDNGATPLSSRGGIPPLL